MAEHKYTVVGDFIHWHKDCSGEMLDNLDYDEAMKIYQEWKQDKIHKNVEMFRDNGGKKVL